MNEPVTMEDWRRSKAELYDSLLALLVETLGFQELYRDGNGEWMLESADAESKTGKSLALRSALRGSARPGAADPERLQTLKTWIEHRMPRALRPDEMQELAALSGGAADPNLRHLAAMLLCETGRVSDPRLDGLKPVDIREIFHQPGRTEPWPEPKPLTEAQVEAVLAEHFRRAALSGGAADPEKQP